MSAARFVGTLAAGLVGVTAIGYVGSLASSERPGLSRVPVSDELLRAGAPVPARQPPPGPARVVLDQNWLSTTATAVGLPVAALRAYATAEILAGEECDVGWATLAGIGWVESRHGTFGGRVLLNDGTSSEPIVGPPLDGRGPVARIPASESGTALHGDERWERAVGPMQFLPSTWEDWGGDADGDGASNPHDLDDTAHAAARYLCADGHDLGTGQGWADAVFGYNHSQAYVDSVHAAASAYASRAPG